MNSRWTSRKFLVALTTQVAAIAVLIWPSRGDAIVAAGQSVAALLVILLSGTSYVSAEASVDRAGRQRAADATDGDPHA